MNRKENPEDKRGIKKSTDVTPETNRLIIEAKEELGMSLGDIIEWAIDKMVKEGLLKEAE